MSLWATVGSAMGRTGGQCGPQPPQAPPVEQKPLRRWQAQKTRELGLEQHASVLLTAMFREGGGTLERKHSWQPTCTSAKKKISQITPTPKGMGLSARRSGGGGAAQGHPIHSSSARSTTRQAEQPQEAVYSDTSLYRSSIYRFQAMPVEFPAHKS